jgi:low temperature requirement protein LtrA
MRIGLLAQWVRAATEDPEGRVTARRYAVGISVAEVAWLLRLILDERRVLPQGSLLPVFVGLVLLEVAVPLWAERARPTSWHPHHIVERYGLFTIILLGEGVLASSTGVAGVLAAGGPNGSLITIALAGLVLVFALWWLYFLDPCADALARRRHRSFLWGYGHFGIFAALAGLGAGLKVAVEHTGGGVDASRVVVGYCVALPVSVFLVVLAAVNAHLVDRPAIGPAVTIAAAGAILLLPLAAPTIGVAAVVAAIALVSALLTAVTITA